MHLAPFARNADFVKLFAGPYRIDSSGGDAKY